jgi:hypothetical protein
VNAFLGLLAERRRRGLAWFLCRTFDSGRWRAFHRGDPEAVRRGWAAAASYWWGRWHEARRRDGGCAGR